MKPIKTESEYEAALIHFQSLLDADPSALSPEEKALLDAVRPIEEYEAIHHPIGPPDPFEAIKFRMEQGGLNSREIQVKTATLIAAIGGAEQVGGSVAFIADSDPCGDMLVYSEGVNVHLYGVFSLLAATIAEMARQEREENK